MTVRSVILGPSVRPPRSVLVLVIIFLVVILVVIILVVIILRQDAPAVDAADDGRPLTLLRVGVQGKRAERSA